jgi:hypothetical protein
MQSIWLHTSKTVNAECVCTYEHFITVNAEHVFTYEHFNILNAERFDAYEAFNTVNAERWSLQNIAPANSSVEQLRVQKLQLVQMAAHIYEVHLTSFHPSLQPTAAAAAAAAAVAELAKPRITATKQTLPLASPLFLMRDARPYSCSAQGPCVLVMRLGMRL